MPQKLSALPFIASFPKTAWISHLSTEEWTSCLQGWILVLQAHDDFANGNFQKRVHTDESVAQFVVSYLTETAQSSDHLSHNAQAESRTLLKYVFLCSNRLLRLPKPPPVLLTWEALADLSKVYGKKRISPILKTLWNNHGAKIETSLAVHKTSLISLLEAGIKGDPFILEQHLKRLNHLLHVSPESAIFFITGSDFCDGLISCYKIMNPPLRRSIITTAYLCLIGLVDCEKPVLSTLNDQLYYLKNAADAHKAGPTSANDSLVAELVTVTPIIERIRQFVDPTIAGSSRTKTVLVSLETFRKSGIQRPKRLIRRKIVKHKERATDQDDYDHGISNQIHVHRMSQITQVQDLFPHLGAGFILKLLDEYSNDVENVISHLLEDTLPEHLSSADTTEELPPDQYESTVDEDHLAPHNTPPQIPVRHNIFDDDELDRLAVDTSRIRFGKRAEANADALLSTRPSDSTSHKAAILSALAAFDSDDDERDDTYDVEDVGGTVDNSAPGANPEEGHADRRAREDNVHEEALFRAWKMSPEIFNRDAATRRSKARNALRSEVNMTDEAVEGWALMLSRDPRNLRQLEAKFSAFSGAQNVVNRSAWTSAMDSGTDGSDVDNAGRGRSDEPSARGRGRGNMRGGRGRGHVNGPTGDKETEVARQRKEAHKGSRANHNRRDQRARKMAKGGFPG